MPLSHPSKPTSFYFPEAQIPPVEETYKEEEARIATIVRALQLLPRETKINFSEVARVNQVTYTRLLARWKGRGSYFDRDVQGRKLTDEQEASLCHFIDFLDEIGLSPLVSEITNAANSILLQNHNEFNPEPAPVVSESWTKRFLERHPKYTRQKQYSIEADRKAVQTPENIEKWFERLLYICNKYNIQLQDIFNFDETGCRVGIGKNQIVVTQDQIRKITLGTATSRELITVVECISAGGFAIPPMVIIPGLSHLRSWYEHTDADDGYLFATSKTGYTNDVLALEWIRHFNRFSKLQQKGEYRLLLIDGHGSHRTTEFLRYCHSNKIIPFALPPHSTHLLQPLDVVVFQPYKHYHSKAIEREVRLGCTDFNKVEFLAQLKWIRENSLKESTLRSAFRATGIHPFNPSIVIDKLREKDLSDSTPLYSESILPTSTPSNSYCLSDLSQSDLTTQPSTIPPSTPPQRVPSPDTPYSTRILRRRLDELEATLVELQATPSKRQRFTKLRKGVMAQATAGELAKKQLSQTTAAEKARKARQAPSGRRRLQIGGVLYVGDGRAMVRDQDEDKARKLQSELVGIELKKQSEKKRFTRKLCLEIHEIRPGFNKWVSWTNSLARSTHDKNHDVFHHNGIGGFTVTSWVGRRIDNFNLRARFTEKYTLDRLDLSDVMAIPLWGDTYTFRPWIKAKKAEEYRAQKERERQEEEKNDRNELRRHGLLKDDKDISVGVVDCVSEEEGNHTASDYEEEEMMDSEEFPGTPFGGDFSRWRLDRDQYE